MSAIADAALDQIFRHARSHNRWLDKPVSHTTLHALYELAKWGPTSANSQPQRIVFVTTAAARQRLKPYLDAGNVEKTMTAPVTAIFAYDGQFYTELGRQFPHNPDARSWFEGTAAAEPTAFRNATLQAGYFLIAARALGLDVGPMSGFNNQGVDKEFFAGTAWKSNFICAIGYGDHGKLFPRGPRLSFDEACKIL